MNDMKNVAVRLRALEPEDLDMLYAMENDHEVWNVGENNVPYSRYVLHDYIANATADIYADRQVRMMVENVDGECVGVVDLVNFSPGAGSSSIDRPPSGAALQGSFSCFSPPFSTG